MGCVYSHEKGRFSFYPRLFDIFKTYRRSSGKKILSQKVEYLLAPEEIAYFQWVRQRWNEIIIMAVSIVSSIEAPLCFID